MECFNNQENRFRFSDIVSKSYGGLVFFYADGMVIRVFWSLTMGLPMKLSQKEVVS